jgi:hypothetical protein
MGAMLGPISFALAMNFPGRRGILVMGILFAAMALIASRGGVIFNPKNKAVN